LLEQALRKNYSEKLLMQLTYCKIIHTKPTGSVKAKQWNKKQQIENKNKMTKSILSVVRLSGNGIIKPIKKQRLSL
jgi:hypothetical protein